MQISGGGALERTGGLESKRERQTYFLAAVTLAQVVLLLAQSSRDSLNSQMDVLEGAGQGVGMLIFLPHLLDKRRHCCPMPT